MIRVIRAIAVLAVAFTSAPGASLAQSSGYVTTSDNATLFYQVIGRGADTILALHGGPGLDLESIAGDFAVLGQKHVVILYDQRGGGKSELPADTMRLDAARQVADLDDLHKYVKLKLPSA